MKDFRLLEAREIDCRAQQVKKDGLILLLYKDARCDMAILDETVGPTNWQRRHTRENANCVVSIYDPDKGSWIEKEDTGTESNTEAEKGLASDSFKRACVNWGIGRELYTAPFIWIPGEKTNIQASSNGRGYICLDKFSVLEIAYNEHREICDLKIVNQNGVEVFRMRNDPASQKQERKVPTLPSCAFVKFTDGKYAGRTISEIWKSDISYIKEYISTGNDTWVQKNIADFQKYLRDRNGN